MPLFAKIRRTFVFGVLCIVLIMLTSAAPATALTAQNRDSVKTQERLQRDIKRFQNHWQDEWQESMIERGAGVFTVDSVAIRDVQYGNFTPNILRMFALSCYAEYAPLNQMFPRQLDAFEKAARLINTPTAYSSIQPGASPELNLLLPTRVNARGNDLAVCPRWIPADEGIPPDEGERLDLAMAIKRRNDIIKRRTALLAELNEAADKAPHDGWIAGQRVRFLIDNLEFEQALSVARACTTSREWCSALAGLVFTQSGDFVRADSAFDHAYSPGIAAPEAVCADTTARPLFELNARL